MNPALALLAAVVLMAVLFVAVVFVWRVSGQTTMRRDTGRTVR